MRRHVVSLLVALNLALVALLVWLWLSPDGQWRNTRWQRPAPVPPALGEVKALPRSDIDLERFVAILDRPLFVPTRRQLPKSEDVAQPPSPEPAPVLRLYGLYGNREAGGIIADVDGKVRRIAVGERIVGRWTLKFLRDDAIVMARGADERTVVLRRTAGSAQGNAVAAREPRGDSLATQAAAGSAGQSATGEPTSGAPQAPAERPIAGRSTAEPSAAVSLERRSAALERRRDAVRRENARRARLGLPPLPEP